jgi:DNA-binding transcriptional LysR family regulator
MLNRNHLALFHAVAEEGGFGLGAKRLRISQPAVSLQVRELESVLGVRLFDRLGRKIRLTEAGEVLLSYTRRIAHLEQEAEAALADLAGLKSGRLSIGASTTIGAYLLPQLLSKFRESYAEVSLHLEIANTEQIQQRLLDGTLDVGLTEGLADEAQLIVEVFREDDLVAIVAPNHPLARKRKVTAEAFLLNRLILREPGSGTREVIEHALARKGLHAQAGYCLGHTEAIKGAVHAGLGVAFVSALAVAGDVKLGRLAIIKLSDLAIHRPLHLLRLQGRTISPSLEAFLALLKKVK